MANNNFMTWKFHVRVAMMASEIEDDLVTDPNGVAIWKRKDLIALSPPGRRPHNSQHQDS
jgi:hypothetical protein